MSVNAFAGDADPRPSGGRYEQREAAAARPDTPEPPREDPADQTAEEMTEEPGYGHGV